MNRLLIAAACAAALSFASPADAAVSISGFGQVVVGTTGDDAEPFPERNFDSDVDFKEESLFAVQVSADLNEHIDVIAQVLARGDKDFDAELAWAYANMRLGDAFTLKAGRQRLGLFRYSDYLDVGYAYPWVRPPVSVYNLGFNNADGLSLSHNMQLGDWYSQAQLFVGGYSGDARFGGTYLDTKLKSLMGASWTVDYNDWLSLRATYYKADVEYVRGTSLDTLEALLTGNGLGALASSLVYDGDPGVFWGVGAQIDRGNLLLVAEFTSTDIDDSLFAPTDGWYLSAGYRFGSVMPIVTLGSKTSDAKLELLDGIPTQNPFYLPILGAVSSQAADEDYAGIGLRWDFMSNIAFKADYTRYRSDISGVPDSDLLSAGVVFTF
jgi:hypothetical protein